MFFEAVDLPDTTQNIPAIVREVHVKQARKELPHEARAWITRGYTLREIAELANDSSKIKEMYDKTQGHINEYIALNGLTTHRATTTYPHKTLWGEPFDQRLLGKLGEIEIEYTDGTVSQKELYAPGFEDFYVAGSAIEMPYGTYDLMQAPLVAHENKVDTVQDFWDSVVVLRKSPIIVTVHDPKEKIPRHGYSQRAEYWTADRFKTPLKLRNGWELSRDGDDIEVAKSSYRESASIVKRSFIATHSTQAPHKITQFHYQGWPDHCGAPDHELLSLLQKVVDEEIAARKLSKNSPITAHCAAGLGRSPTFAISHLVGREIRERLNNGEKLDAIKIDIIGKIFAFNTQRPHQLTDPDQWQSVFLSIRRMYLEKQGIANKKIRAIEEKIEAKTLKKAAAKLQADIQKREDAQAAAGCMS